MHSFRLFFGDFAHCTK